MGHYRNTVVAISEGSIPEVRIRQSVRSYSIDIYAIFDHVGCREHDSEVKSEPEVVSDAILDRKEAKYPPKCPKIDIYRSLATGPTSVISGTGFYGSNDPTNSVKALKEDRSYGLGFSPIKSTPPCSQ